MYDKKSKDIEKGKGKSRKNNKSRSKTDRKDTAKDYVSEMNDPRWYASNEQLLKDSASYSYGFATGTRFRLNRQGYIPTVENNDAVSRLANSSVPGIMSLYYAPSCGWADQANSPVNVASRNLYSFLRQANSGSKNYDAPDLMIYVMAIDSAISHLEWMKRLYGVLSLSSVLNRYYSVALTEAVGGKYTDLIGNLADFRAHINMFAVKLAAMATPANMSYTAKHKWLTAGVYADRPDPKAQLYAFVPSMYWIFDKDVDGAGKLVSKTYPFYGNPGGCTFAQITTISNEILNPLLYSYGEEDFNIISGDILKAYGTEGVYRAELISEDYTVLPAYDELVLAQIQNATIISSGDPGWYNNFDITQNANKEYLVHTPQFLLSTGVPQYMGHFVEDRVIISQTATPDPAFSMEATRLCNILKLTPSEGTDSYIGAVETIGSEMVVNAKIWYYADNGGVWTLNYNQFNSFPAAAANITDTAVQAIGKAANLVTTLSLVSNFNQAPSLYPTLTIYDEGPISLTTIKDTPTVVGDISNYTVVTFEDLVQMSEVALMSQFGLEKFGR